MTVSTLEYRGRLWSTEVFRSVNDKGKGEGSCLCLDIDDSACLTDFTFPRARWAVMQVLIQPWICALGTRYCWVNRGSVEY